MPRVKQPDTISAAVEYSPCGYSRTVEISERPGAFHGYALTFVDGETLQMVTLDDDDLDALSMAVATVRLRRSEDIDDEPPTETDQCPADLRPLPFVDGAAAACDASEYQDLLEDAAA